MKATEQLMTSSSSDGIWKALRPSPLPSGQPAEAEASKELGQPSSVPLKDIRRLMLQSQEFRSIMPSANTNPAVKGNPKDIDGTTIDTVFACLAICADEERRAISFGSREGAAAMRRSMHAIKKKFGIS